MHLYLMQQFRMDPDAWSILKEEQMQYGEYPQDPAANGLAFLGRAFRIFHTSGSADPTKSYIVNVN